MVVSSAVHGCLVVTGMLMFILGQQVHADVATVSARNSDFAMSMYKQVIAEAGDKENIFMSPVSISSAFAMLYAGAKGDTKLQMAKALELQGLTDSVVMSGFKAMLATFNDNTNNYTLAMANRIYGQKNFTFLSKFLQDTQKNFDAGLESVDFKTDPEGNRKKINDWVETNTMNKIKELMTKGMVSSDTIMVLVNAIYFKGNWTYPFSAQNTQKENFNLADNSKVLIDMMSTTESFKMADSGELGCMVLELPYAGDEVAMYIMVPTQNNGLGAVEDKLTRTNIDAAISKLVKRKIALKMPKFKLTQRISLNKFMQALGMTDAFVAGKADLSGISGTKNLAISGATHKAYIDVNEEGTEAAAATGIGVVITSMPMQFEVNKPFIFIIREKTTGSILFLGRLVKPSSDAGEVTLGGYSSGSPANPGGTHTPMIWSLVASVVTLMISLIRS